jgi:hypothetical protein
MDFDLDAAGLRADAADLKTYIEILARKLELALPAQTTVQRRSKGFLSREKVVESITVALGDFVYELQADGRASRAKAVRGITIKTEPLEPDDWVRALGGELSARAGESAEARAALERLVD